MSKELETKIETLTKEVETLKFGLRDLGDRGDNELIYHIKQLCERAKRQVPGFDYLLEVICEKPSYGGKKHVKWDLMWPGKIWCIKDAKETNLSEIKKKIY